MVSRFEIAYFKVLHVDRNAPAVEQLAEASFRRVSVICTVFMMNDASSDVLINFHPL